MKILILISIGFLLRFVWGPNIVVRSPCCVRIGENQALLIFALYHRFLIEQGLGLGLIQLALKLSFP